MKTIIRKAGLSLLMLGGTITAHADDFQPVAGQAIPFVPFKIEDFCRVYFNGTCESYYSDRSQAFSNEEVFKGTVGAYVDYLNSMEKLYNANGHTLRPQSESADDEVNRPYEIPTPAAELKSQLLNLLGLNTEKVLETVLGLDPNAECPTLPIPGRDIEDPGFSYPKFSVPGINQLPLDDIIRRFNEHQNVFCSFGMSLYEKLDPHEKYRPEDLIKKLLDVRNEILAKLGLSEYSGAFSMESLQDIQAGIDIAKDIADLIEAKEIPSPEQLFALREKLNLVIPDEWEIPDIPNIPSPTPPTRRDLEIKKRKDWSGFNYGKRDRFATYANAYLELRGSETEQQATAFGATGIYILNNEINALGGYATAFAGPEKISLDMEFKAFGQNVFPPQHFAESVQIIKSKPDAFGYDYDKEYQKTFMVGPVPVTVGLGARIGLLMGYSYGVYTTQLKGSIDPSAFAEGYAWGEAGIPGLLSVGAKASLTILNAKLPLTGYAGVNFDQAGYPFLKLAIDSKLQYTALNGRAYAFANYLVPRWGLPPVKKKTSEYEIFAWAGMKGDHSIMNWGMELGRNGTKLTGELLDQTDRAEAQALQTAIDIDNRKEALASYQADVQNKVSAIFNGIRSDLLSEGNLQALKYDGLLGESIDNAATTIDTYEDRVSAFFQDRSTRP